ncbi:hypothetical protein V8D89_001714 [Ganoderma adspersum]
MLQVLSRSPLPHLDHLQLSIAPTTRMRPSTILSRLFTLEVHRLRPEGVDEIPVAAIGEELGSLSRLHTLSLHLDSPDQPVCCPDLRKIGFIQVVLTYAQMKAADRTLRSQANLLTTLLSRSIRRLSLVEWDTEAAAWRTYPISRADGADSDGAVCTRHDRACSTEYLRVSPNLFVDLLGLD